MAHRKSGKTARKPARSTPRTGTRTNRRIAHESPRRATTHAEPAPEAHAAVLAASLPPHELYRHEKRRRAGQRSDERDPLEEARREFKAMLEAGVGTPRGGRPRKVKPQPTDDDG